MRSGVLKPIIYSPSRGHALVSVIGMIGVNAIVAVLRNEMMKALLICY